jgi:hypothetical protein
MVGGQTGQIGRTVVNLVVAENRKRLVLAQTQHLVVLEHPVVAKQKKQKHAIPTSV